MRSVVEMPGKRICRPSRSVDERTGSEIGKPNGSSGDGVTKTLEVIVELVQQQTKIAQQQVDTARILAAMMARLPKNATPDNNVVPPQPVIPLPTDDMWL